ncbi:MAG TPA: hypothetical protein VGL11_24820 [Candidatus Binatia bacterium]
MTYRATERCCKCGKEIVLKDVMSYKVLPTYRLICEDCAREDGLIAPAKQRRTAGGASASKKTSRR